MHASRPLVILGGMVFALDPSLTSSLADLIRALIPLIVSLTALIWWEIRRQPPTK